MEIIQLSIIKNQYYKVMEHKFISSKNFFSSVKKAVSLYKNIWRECTTALIHGPRTADKSEKALDIALDVARSGREVLYVNAEDRLGRNCRHSESHENLYVFTPEYESIDDTADYADLVFEAIEQAVRTTQIRTFVIDSISRIAALSFGRNASVAYIMKRIVALQVKCKLSVLVVADDSTKSANNALLALAATEIILSESSEPSEHSEFSEISEISEPDAPAEISDYSIPIPVMTRQQRRAMERRAAKEARRNKR